MPENKKFTPELLSRQGEMTAWLLALPAGLGLYLLSLRAALPFWAWFLFGMLFISALSISLGNWMDRKTLIQFTENGVKFQNGLRNADIPWERIEQVRTAPARWGTSVQVISQQTHFSFATLGEMRFQGQVRGKTGFANGKEIMDEIIHSAGLTMSTHDGQFMSYTRAGSMQL